MQCGGQIAVSTLTNETIHALFSKLERREDSELGVNEPFGAVVEGRIGRLLNGVALDEVE